MSRDKITTNSVIDLIVFYLWFLTWGILRAAKQAECSLWMIDKQWVESRELGSRAIRESCLVRNRLFPCKEKAETALLIHWYLLIWVFKYHPTPSWINQKVTKPLAFIPVVECVPQCSYCLIQSVGPSTGAQQVHSHESQPPVTVTGIWVDQLQGKRLVWAHVFRKLRSRWGGFITYGPVTEEHVIYRQSIWEQKKWQNKNILPHHEPRNKGVRRSPGLTHSNPRTSH